MKCVSKINYEREISLRSSGGYSPFPTNGNKFVKSLFPHISKLWNSLDKKETSKNLEDFKIYTKSLKPKR